MTVKSVKGPERSEDPWLVTRLNPRPQASGPVCRWSSYLQVGELCEGFLRSLGVCTFVRPVPGVDSAWDLRGEKEDVSKAAQGPVPQQASLGNEARVSRRRQLRPRAPAFRCCPLCTAQAGLLCGRGGLGAWQPRDSQATTWQPGSSHSNHPSQTIQR